MCTVYGKKVITYAFRSCGAEGFNCTALGLCPTIPDQPYWPVNAAICGFDTDVNQLMVCCPLANIQSVPAAPVPPR
jgi:hypothetical protein